MNRYPNKNLYKAFELYARQQDALLPTEEALASVTLSPEFHGRMERMLTRRKRGYYVLFGTWGRRVASFVVALLIATVTVTFGVKAVRERVMSFFAERWERNTHIAFSDDVAQVDGLARRVPAYLPDGYGMTEETVLDELYRVTYTHADGDEIGYTQRRSESLSLDIDTENSGYTTVTIGDCQGVLYSNKGVTTVTFADGGYVYTVFGSCSAEELLRIAASIG